MLKNYLVVAMRNLLRQKLYSLINVTGMAVGLAFCILALLYIRHEWTYDSFHERADSIYLVEREVELGGQRYVSDRSSPPVGPMLAETFPQIRSFVRLLPRGSSGSVRRGNVLFKERVLMADPWIFEVFSFDVVAGDPKTALSDLGSVVLSREAATRYFGDEDPIGETLSIAGAGAFGSAGSGELEDFMVTGVVDVPTNTSIRFDVLVSLGRALSSGQATRWDWDIPITYVMVEDGADLRPVEEGLAALLNGKMRERMGKYAATTTIRLRSLTQLHVDDEVKRVSAILGAISAAVLLMGCVNFTNLSVGLSSIRFREVGLRKVLGARRAQVAGQFWGEAGVISCAALGFGAVLAEIFLPTFNTLMNAELDIRYGELWPFLLLLAALVALLSGSYPSLVLSGYHPVEVLRGRLKIGGPSRFGRGLVVLQLTLSATFIAVALIMNAQMRLIAAADLGFDRESVVVVRLRRMGMEDPARVLQAYQTLARTESRIVAVSGAEATLAGMPGSFMDVSDEGREFRYYFFHADYDFLATAGIELIEGRDISRERDSDRSQAMLVNETFAREMGWEAPFGLPRPAPEIRGQTSALVIGHGSRPGGAPPPIAFRDKTVVGVVADFHNLSLHQKMAPVAILHPNESRSYPFIFARCTPGSLTEAVVLLEREWRRLVPDIPFHYTFLDEDVATQYSAEQRWLRIVEYAAAFAVCIACFGAFGLTSLAVARRTREVGIRKVLGASVPSIAGLLSRDFAVLVVIGSALAWPLAHSIAADWLESFAYRVDLGAGVFLLGGLLTLAVVLLTVTTQCVRAGLADPAATLRTE